MILGLLLGVVRLLLGPLVGAVPEQSVNLPTLCDSAESTCSGLFAHAGWLDWYLPLDLVAVLVKALLVLVPLALSVRGILWVYHQVWGS